MSLVDDLLVRKQCAMVNIMRLGYTCIFIVATLFFNSIKVQAETLLEFYNIALQSDTKLALARSSLGGASARLEKSASWLKPQINLLANQKWNNTDYIRATSSYPSSFLSLTLTLPLFDYGRWLDVDEARAYITHEEALYASSRQDLIIRVATVFFDLLAAQESLALAKTEQHVFGQQLSQTTQRFDAGFSTTVDVHEAQAAYDLAVAQEITAQSDLDTAQEAVFEIAGQPLGSASRLKEDIPLTLPEPQNIDSWVELALQNNFDVLAQQAVVDAANEALSGVKAEHLPTLSLVTGLTYLNTLGSLYEEESTTRYVGFELDIPIYSGGLTTAKTKEASLFLTQAKTTLEQIRRSTVGQSRSAYLAVNVGIALINARKQSTRSAEAVVVAMEAEFKAGRRTVVEVLDAQRDLFRAQNELIHARYDYLLALLALKKSVGSLHDSDLASIDSLFENTTL